MLAFVCFLRAAFFQLGAGLSPCRRTCALLVSSAVSSSAPCSVVCRFFRLPGVGPCWFCFASCLVLQARRGFSASPFVLFCFVLYLRDRPHSEYPHMGHLTDPRVCAAGHTPHTLCGAVKRPRVRLQPIRIHEAFAGRDAQSSPSERLTGSVMSDTPLPGPRRAGTRVPSRMVLYSPAR